jgi:hypothetical protein
MSKRRNHAPELDALLSRLLQQFRDTSHEVEPSVEVDRLLFELRKGLQTVEEHAWSVRQWIERFEKRLAELRIYARKTEQEHKHLEARP